MKFLRVLSMLAMALTAPAVAAEKPAAPATRPASRPAVAPESYPLPPTMSDVKYGPHRKNVMHFWKAESKTPTPLLFFIHGGGWTAGNRSSGLAPLLTGMLKNGISVVSVEYRFIPEATAEKVVPPVKGPLSDCARALQFVRSKSAEWNIDKTKIAASGGSAGACTSLWLAFHDDMADGKSEDPIARESTRLLFAAVSQPQTTLDPKQMKEWTPNSKYGAHAFGISAQREGKGNDSFGAYLAAREKILPWIKEYSPYELVTKDDSPVYMLFNAPPNLGKDEKDPTHTANFGVKLQEHCKEIGVPCELVYPGAPDVKHPTLVEALLAALKK
jgi:acetyl esterase/lipase